jgi:LmeA-like phospholipid-binding
MTTIKPKRRRGRRIVIAVVLALVGLMVAADFTFAAIGEYQVSKKMRSELKLADDPSVTIHGFPFVLQATRGDYQDIEVSASGIPIADTMRDLQVSAHLYDVKVPLSELVSGSAHSVVIDRVEGQVKISAADVNRAFNSTDVGTVLNVTNLTIVPASADTLVDPGADPGAAGAPVGPETRKGVKMAFFISVGNKQLKVSAYGVLALSGTEIQVQPTRLELADGVTTLKLPDFIQTQVMSALSTKLNLGKALPFAVMPTDVIVDNNAFIVIGKATNVQLGSGKSGLG